MFHDFPFRFVSCISEFLLSLLIELLPLLTCLNCPLPTSDFCLRLHLRNCGLESWVFIRLTPNLKPAWVMVYSYFGYSISHSTESPLVSALTIAVDLWNNYFLLFFFFFAFGVTAPSGLRPPHYRGFTITLRRTIIDRTPLNEWTSRRREIYLTTHTPTQDRPPWPGSVRTRKPSKRADADHHLRPRGYWGRKFLLTMKLNLIMVF